MLKKGLVIIAVPFLFQIAFIAALWKAYQESAAAQVWAIHTKDVIAQTESVARFVTQAQSDVRGLIVTGDPSLSRSYAEAARVVPLALGRLRELVGNNTGQQHLVDDLGATIRS
ncbi:MAG: CHASE3 domain-containing protein, partial [Planctomycetia bacterium]|nr:CHASE3 domain-containing protein [Planctomycetia bacterium]